MNNLLGEFFIIILFLETLRNCVVEQAAFVGPGQSTLFYRANFISSINYVQTTNDYISTGKYLRAEFSAMEFLLGKV